MMNTVERAFRRASVNVERAVCAQQVTAVDDAASGRD